MFIFFSFSFIQNQNHLDLPSIPFKTKKPHAQMLSQPQLILLTHLDSNLLTSFNFTTNGFKLFSVKTSKPTPNATFTRNFFGEPTTTLFSHFCHKQRAQCWKSKVTADQGNRKWSNDAQSHRRRKGRK